MTSEAEVDQLIASWDVRLARVDENLIALEGEPTYQILSGRGGQKVTLEGITRQKVLPALEALGQLFEQRQRLTEVVDRAKAVRASVGFWDKEQKLLEIRELLYGPSIKMSAAPTPLSRRNLLDPAPTDVGVIPEQLLFAMSNAFQVARDAVAEVSQAWRQLDPFLEGVEREIASLKAAAKELGDASAAPDVEWLAAELARVRGFVATDPLGVQGGAEAALTPRVEQLRHRLTEQRAARGRVSAGLEEAAAFERECVAIHASARAARARAREELSGAALPAGADEALVLGLSAWREKIAATALAGRAGPAEIGLKRWMETARSYRALDEAVLGAFQALLGQRTELAGRLSARRAQLDALVARGIAAPKDLVARGSAAEALLRARPTSLEAASRAVDAYAAEVVALANRARRG